MNRIVLRQMNFVNKIPFLQKIQGRNLANQHVNSAGSVCDQKSSKVFVLWGRIHGRTCGYKWDLVKLGRETQR
jgi:hypothetical protein